MLYWCAVVLISRWCEKKCIFIVLLIHDYLIFFCKLHKINVLSSKLHIFFKISRNNYSYSLDISIQFWRWYNVIITHDNWLTDLTVTCVYLSKHLLRNIIYKILALVSYFLYTDLGLNVLCYWNNLLFAQLRKAIEDVNSGTLTIANRPEPPTTPMPMFIKVPSSQPAPPTDSETAKLTVSDEKGDKWRQRRRSWIKHSCLDLG